MMNKTLIITMVLLSCSGGVMLTVFSWLDSVNNMPEQQWARQLEAESLASCEQLYGDCGM